MTTPAQRWARTVRIAQGVGGVGFILARLLLSVCNIPALCGPLAGVSWLLAVVYIVTYLGRATERLTSAVGRGATHLLALTCVLHLAASVLDPASSNPFLERTGLVYVLDLVTWVWALCVGLAAARWLWGQSPTAAATRTEPVAPRHLSRSALIAAVLALQVWALATGAPHLWPFMDYRLYSASHGTPVRAVHHRLYGLTAQEPITFIEITSEALGMSWFVYHTQFIPQLFDTPWLVVDELQRKLADSDVPPLRLVLPERKTFDLDGGRLGTFGEHRVVPVDETRLR